VRRWHSKPPSNLKHQPVMADRVVEFLSTCPDGVLVDATVGAGGHLKEVYKACESRFEYYGFDLDNRILEQTKKALTDGRIKAELVKANFSTIADFLHRREISEISAVVYDLGIGSYQIDEPGRGFSYLAEGPLTMSFDEDSKMKAVDLIDGLSEKELASVFKTYGQEKHAKRIARAIKRSPEKMTSTGELADLIRSTVGDRYFVKTAARIFMAIRIKVNNELENIEKSLATVIPILKPRGRAAVISYHSVEDGIVKKIFKKFSGRCVCPSGVPECRCGRQKLIIPITKKPITASPAEIGANPRARSAKLRVVERIETAA
jgi:16S rRNA (cytosine1402-N4)-methyltransferase